MDEVRAHARARARARTNTWFASMKWWSWPLPDLKMTIFEMMKGARKGRRMVHIMFMYLGASGRRLRGEWEAFEGQTQAFGLGWAVRERGGGGRHHGALTMMNMDMLPVYLT